LKIDEFNFLPSVEIGFIKSDDLSIDAFSRQKSFEAFEIGDDNKRFPKLNLDKLYKYIKFYTKINVLEGKEEKVYRN
jgi:hypothetical protein